MNEIMTIPEECSHHWLIEGPNGPTSHAVCRLCGEERDFYNSVAKGTWPGASIATNRRREGRDKPLSLARQSANEAPAAPGDRSA